jgi:hypothetical protein
VDEHEKYAAFVASLGTEYFVLQGVSSATISESSSRSSLYLVTLSSGLVSLGFVLGASRDAFLPFAAAVLPTVFILGIFTIVRLVDTSVENVVALRGMARIRQFYAALSPEALAYFPSTGDEAKDAQNLLGVRYSPRAVLFTMASTIGVVNALLGGTGVALLIYTLTGRSGTLAILIGIGAAVVMFATCIAYQFRRFASGLTLSNPTRQP